jgi:hypothetical protein
MTIIEKIKDAVGLGHGASAPTGRTDTRLIPNCTVIANIPQPLPTKKCRRQSFLCRTATPAHTSSYRSIGVDMKSTTYRGNAR